MMAKVGLKGLRVEARRSQKASLRAQLEGLRAKAQSTSDPEKAAALWSEVERLARKHDAIRVRPRKRKGGGGLW